MTLRPARPEDASALAALSIEVWVGTYLRQGVSGFFADYAMATYSPGAYRQILATPHEHLWVSQNRVGIDGFMRLCENSPCPVAAGDDLELATLYVQPRHQGRKLGHALLNKASEIARQLGHDHLWLTTNSENTPAIGFYTAQGAEIIGQTDFVIDDQRYPNTVFRVST
ncbi:MAG: GNAT family N-acetyltransferase [Pelagimonas sp.]|jgi:ribosomal protein S18 acetylase RimI-like enzyme|nr:GNAT family N-acetyltransferase [Pelagimonas sp.]